jgi:ligand-binding SRPBCC domain-containing protein
LVLGLDGGALAQMLPPFQFGAGGPIGNGRQYVPWIHLFDLVELIAAALANPRYTGAVIAAAPNPVTNREFARTLGRVLHRPSLVPVPAFALRVIFGDGASVLTSGQRGNPARLKELGFKWRFETLEPALRQILTEDDPAIESLDANSPRPANPVNSGYLEQNPPGFVLRHATRVEAPLAQVFSFFSRPENLGVITPADMRFQIVGPVPDQMSQGTEIEYTMRVGPIPLHWRTQIETVQAQRLFIDSQQRGPYRCWWHEHYFQPDGNATTMEDRVYFAPPFGMLGAMASHAVVMPALRRIFRFRAQAMRLRFPGAAHQATAGTTAS